VRRKRDWLTSQSIAAVGPEIGVATARARRIGSPSSGSPQGACGQLRTPPRRTLAIIVGMDGWRCAHCGREIGVYEPAVIVEDQQERETSRLAERRAPAAAYHVSCRPHAGGRGRS
jgi:hypothetical protein